MRRTPIRLCLLGAAVVAACAPARPPASVVVPEPGPAPAPAFPHAVVWTARDGVPIVTAEGAAVPVPRMLTRLDVLGADTAELRVRCRTCAGEPEGDVAIADVVVPTASLAEAAEARDVAQFALAVRNAAAERDVEALRAVMDPGFVHSVAEEGSRIEAFGQWQREEYRTLDAVAALIDRGIVSRWQATNTAARDELWIAPPEFVADRAYTGPRLGFRSLNGRWVWVFLVPGG